MTHRYNCLGIITIILSSILAFTPAGAAVRVTILPSNGSEFVLEVETSDIRIDDVSTPEGEFAKIILDGESRRGLPGAPDVPHVSRLIAIPPDTPVSLSWETEPPRLIHPAIPVMVSPLISVNDFSSIDIDELPVEDGYWPPALVTIDKPVIMRGNRLIRVTVNPVQVNLQTGDLRIWEKVRVRLDFTSGEVVNTVINPHKPRPSKSAGRLLRSVVVNPADLLRDDGTRLGTHVYIVPDYDGVTETIQPLVDWRRRKGYPTEVIIVDDDASNVEVKRAITTAYEEWESPPDIITLVGDADLEHADFMIPTWDVGRAYMWETDYWYVLLEGDDLLPEAAIGRISCRSLAELRRVVAKLIRYEVEPSTENEEWFTSAALMSNYHETGYSTVYLQRWVRKLLQEIGFAEIDTFYFIHDNEVSGNNFIRNSFNNGISLFNYRGWGHFAGDWNPEDARMLRNEGMWPVVIMPTCNTADFADHVQYDNSYAEEFLWADGGAIGAVGSSGFTHTNYNNVFDGGMINGFYRDFNWQLGWALNQGKLELYRHFGAFNDIQDPQVPDLLVWEATVYQTNLIGDAATELWTAVPFELTVRHPAEISVGESIITLTAVDEDDAPVAGVVVTAMREGELLRMEYTDVEGRVDFILTEDEMIESAIDITGSKHNALPYIGEIDLVAASNFVGFSSFDIDDDRAGRSFGNADGIGNPGERIELTTYLKNFGDEAPDGELNIVLHAVEGDVSIVMGAAHLDQSPEMGDSVAVGFLIDVGQECIDGSRIVLDVTIETDDGTWVSGMEIPLSAPDLEVASVEYDPPVFGAGDTVWVDVTIRNVGSLNSPAMSAHLISRREVVAVFISHAEFNPVEKVGDDSLATARFQFFPHDLTIPGTNVEMLLYLESEDGFGDSAWFDFTVGSPEDDTPFGPDAYGYGCFDDTDADGWPEMAPEYDWVEIDPSLDGDGVDTEIHDLGNEQDWSILVNFPDGFDFQYYGTEFDQITICSNGWLAFGDESKLADFQNRRIPPALGPRAQVCVFWDDLVNYIDDDDVQIGGIFYWFDEENHRFIIEWSRMRRYVGLLEDEQMREGGLNTFQAILYDPQHYQTYSGDGDIVFQYRTVNNDRAVDPTEFDTPFATVGIVNLNGTDGMEYTYWNEYHPGAAVLEDERAIKFSTRLVAVVGSVTGLVVDEETDSAIAGAEVRGSRGAFAITDDNGRYIMDNVLIGEGYYFTAGAEGFNDSTNVGADSVGFTVLEGDTLTLNFALLHPEFALDADSLGFEIQPDHVTMTDITLSNDGNGPLFFRSYFDYSGDEDAQLWTRILDFNASEISGDTRINGVDYFNGRLWVTGSNNNQNPNYFYRFNTEGELVNGIEQPSGSSFGLRGTTTSDGVIYGGEGRWILGIDADGEVLDSIPGPLQIQRAIVLESFRDSVHFWVANGADDPLVRINTEGEVVAEYNHELDIYGLGWLPDDLDGFPLYILSRNKTHPELQVPEALVSKFNPQTQELRSIIALEADLEARAGGMEIVNGFDPRKWVMLTVLNHPDGDRVSVYDMGPNTTWVSYNPRYGRLDAGERTNIHFTINTTDLAEGVYSLVLSYIHNAEGLQSNIPLYLSVDWDHGIGSGEVTPFEFRLDQNYPNPFNSSTIIRFSLPETAPARLTIYDITGRQVAILGEGRMEAGSHQLEFDAGELSSGIYLVKLTSGSRSNFVKMALIK